MAVFKCKMCGGNLEVADNMSVCECEYCGTKQTVPKTRDDIVFNLFNRANNLRIKCEFDKAQEIYEKIVASNPDEAEAYWGIVLCKYGIEYVEDPATFKKVPTCHRTQLESVMTDVDYLAAMEHADVVQRSIYESEARNIDGLQKNILEIVHNEKPFDVFICYKETDKNGKRTNDSVIANDIYYQLTTEGFKVFYAAITLEDKIGQEYEPYIFAALNSAKVMLVIGSKPEYFTAVWVKNEWSRYMKLMKTDRSKLLIPCYKDMDAYDLPEEFSHLQAQDMSKIGFINDVIRGIRKVLSKNDTTEKNAAPVQHITTTTVSTNLENMLKRGMLALEDEKWEDADNFFEQVLNENVEEPRAYIGKMLSSLKAKSEDGLIDSAPIKAISLENNEYFKKACRFAGEELKAHLVELNNRYLFSSGMKRFNSAITEDNYIDAKAVFDKMSDYQPAKEQAVKCKIKAADCVYRNADEILSTSNNKNQLSFAKHEFLRINWHKDSENKATQCDNKIKQIEDDEKDSVYQNAIKVVTDDNSTEFQLREALSILKKMSGWKMADSIANTCKERLKAIEEQERIKQEKEAERQRILEATHARKRRTIIATACIAAAITIGFSIMLKEVIIPEVNYNNAKAMMSEGDYSNAVTLLQGISSYKDARYLLSRCINYGTCHSISSGYSHSASIGNNGTIKTTGQSRYDQHNTSTWHDIIDVSEGYFFTVGLKENGTVLSAGINTFDQCNTSDWTDVVAVSAGDAHTVGLKADGTVVSTGFNKYDQCNVSDWTNIIAISAGNTFTVGLKADGTVVSTGYNKFGQSNVSNWHNIVSVSAGTSFTIGLEADGTVVSTGNNSSDQCSVSEWNDIVAVSAGYTHTVGLRKDGTVVATGDNSKGQCEVSDWYGIIAISAGHEHTIGLKSDGTVVATGRNDSGQCDVSDWTDIKTTNQ